MDNRLLIRKSKVGSAVVPAALSWARGLCAVAVGWLLLGGLAAQGQMQAAALQAAEGLPDSPGAVQATLEQRAGSQADPQSVIVLAKASYATSGNKPPRCHTRSWFARANTPKLLDADGTGASGQSSDPPPLSCVNILDPYVRFLDTRFSIPMTPSQKAYLAFRDLTDPFNIATIIASSGITIASDADTAYGPGMKGWGKLTGVTFLQDATGEFFGTFLIPSLTHEDPHYHRMPHASIPRRVLHAASRTVIAQNDDGTLMPNFAVLLTYPIASEISNLYVPGIQSDGPSTTKRILTGYALDPVNNLITEFLPDVAKRIHIRVIFVQRILNEVAASPTPGGT